MAMGLASMNPMVGPNANNNGVLLFKQKDDKDVTDGWSSYGATRSFDNEDYISIDKNGKPGIRKMKDLDESNVVIYSVNTEDADTIMDRLVNEATKPYYDRIILPYNLYEEFTRHVQYVEDQPDYDTLLERVYLDKLTKTMTGIARQVDVHSNRMVDGSTEGYYSLGGKQYATPEEDDSSVQFPVLASAMPTVEEAEARFNSILNGEDETIVDD